MKRSVLPVLMVFVFLLLSSTEGWSLPPCPGSPTSRWSTHSNWTDCFGIFTYGSGEKYVGEWKDGKRHGQGTLSFTNGSKYVGEWKDRSMHGQGTQYNADGSVKREGIWEDGKFQYAKKTSPIVTARTLSPTVTAKKAPTKGGNLPPCKGSPTASISPIAFWTDCLGTLTYKGHKYVGEWKDNKINGQGTYTFADGDKYVGEHKDGKPHGQGTATFFDGSKYVGEHKDGKPHGQGTYTDPDGNKYVGEWKNNKKHGQGTFTFVKSGKKWVGEWKDNKLNGQGTLTFADGSKYVGEFKNSMRHGQGTMTFADGDKYVGEYKDGKPHGQGTIYFLAENKIKGEKFVGKFKNGKRHGQGLHTHTDGTVYQEGTWENGEFLYAKKTPKVDQQKRLELARRTQEALQVLDLYSGKLDGIIGVITKSAIQRWQKRNGYSGTGEVTELQLAKLEQEAITHLATKKSKPSVTAKKTEPKPVQNVAKRPDDIAVIIANSNYRKLGKDIPNVTPAYNDAENIKKYFMESLGVREGNIIYLKDATGAQLTEVFGNEKNHKAQLFDWVRPNKSNVHIYYAGHGAPASKDGSAYLVPSDAKSQTIEFSGYLLTNLYRNLDKIRARSVTVILEACFSGFSQAGALLPRSSGSR